MPASLGPGPPGRKQMISRPSFVLVSFASLLPKLASQVVPRTKRACGSKRRESRAEKAGARKPPDRRGSGTHVARRPAQARRALIGPGELPATRGSAMTRTPCNAPRWGAHSTKPRCQPLPTSVGETRRLIPLHLPHQWRTALIKDAGPCSRGGGGLPAARARARRRPTPGRAGDEQSSEDLGGLSGSGSERRGEEQS